MRGLVGRRLGGGASSFNGVRLVQPGALAGGGIITFTRSQVTAVATAFNPSNNLVEYAADVPRFNGAAQRLLIEPQRTNVMLSSRFEGAALGVIGSGGTLPPGWAHVGAGVTAEITSITPVQGLPALTIRYSSASAPAAISLNMTGGLTINAGDTANISVWHQLVAGSFTNVTSASFVGFTPATPLPTSTFTRVDVSRTTTGTVSSVFRYVCSAGSPIDFTVTLAAPQFVMLPVVSTPVFPTVGTAAASTAGQDNATSTFSSLFPTGVGTILGSFMLPFNASATTDQMLFEVNDGTANNRIRLRNVAGGATLVAGQVIGGVATDAPSIGSMTAGTLFKVGLTFDGTTITANFNGGTNQTVAGIPTGLTTFRIGNNAAGTACNGIEVGYVDVLPYVIPDASLPAAVTAIPS